jgi:hypothetical protein
MLLAITMIAVVGLSLAVAILATNDESSSGTTAVNPISEVNYGGVNPANGRTMVGRVAEPTPVQSIRPEETGVAAAIAQPPVVARPDESKVAASISRTQQLQTPSQLQTPNQHDESDVAAAISRRK